MQDLRSTVFERNRDALFSSSLNSSQRSVRVDPGTSYLTPWSGPPTLRQNSCQEFFNPRTTMMFPTDGTNVFEKTVGRGRCMKSTGLPSEVPRSRKMQNGTEFCLPTTCRSMMNTNSSSSFVWPDIQNSDHDKAVIRHINTSNDASKISSSRKDWHYSSHGNPGNMCCNSVQRFLKIPSEVDAALNRSPAFLSGCPRVSCFGTSGYLLLSKTGLLGILCSCHFLHMSVLKFCEHSGLCNVNPGDVVYLDSGETIAQWRKQYFLRFGIRVPEDQWEWDLPDTLSKTAGMGNSTLRSQHAHLVDLTGGFTTSEHHLDSIFFSKQPNSAPDMVSDALQIKQPKHGIGSDNSLLRGLPVKQPKNGQGSDNSLFKGLLGSLERNLCPMVDNQKIKCPSNLGLPNFGIGTGGGNKESQFLSAYTDFVVKDGSVSITERPLQKLNKHYEDSDGIRIRNTNAACLLRENTASNIELRLGQPYHHSQAPRDPILSVTASQPLDTIGNPAKLLFQEHLLVDTPGTRILAESRKSGSNITHGTLRCSGISPLSNTINAVSHTKFRVNVAETEMVSSTNTPNFSPESVLARSNISMVNSKKNSVPNALHCEYDGVECKSVDILLHEGTQIAKKFENSEVPSFRFSNGEEGMGFLSDGIAARTGSNIGIPKPIEFSSQFSGTVGGPRDSCNSRFQETACSQHLSTVQQDITNTRNFFNYSGIVPSLSGGQFDQFLCRSTDSSPTSSGLAMQPQIVSVSFPLDFPVAVSNQIQSLTRQCPLDKHQTIHAPREAWDSFKQRQSISPLEVNQDNGDFRNTSNVHQPLSDTLSSWGERHETNCSGNQNLFGVVMKQVQSGTTCWLEDDMKMLLSTTGCSELTTHIQFPPTNGEPSPRNGDDITQLHKHKVKRCCLRIPVSDCKPRYSCAAHDDVTERAIFSPSPFDQHMETVTGKTSLANTSSMAENHNWNAHIDISCDESGKVNGQLARNVAEVSQWRSVPGKGTDASELACIDVSATVLDDRGLKGFQLGAAPAESFPEVLEVADSLKEQEISNISSGSFAPAVTMESIKLNNVESSADAQGGCVKNVIVDEGSGIGKCWSSEDSQESERSLEFLGYMSEESSMQESNIQSSRSLLDELKILDSLTWKKCPNERRGGSICHGKPLKPGKSYGNLKLWKRKKPMKWKKLDASIPTGYCSIGCEQSHRHLPLNSPKSSQMFFPSDEGISCLSRHNFYERTSKHRLSVPCSVKSLSRKRDLNKLYDVERVEDNCLREGSAVWNEPYKESGRKKFIKVSSFDDKTFRNACNPESFRDYVIEDPTAKDGKASKKCESVECIKPLTRQLPACLTKLRPVVCGKYGEISCRNLVGGVSKPPKIVSLSGILKTAERYTPAKLRKSMITSTQGSKMTNCRRGDVRHHGLVPLMKHDSGNHSATDFDKRKLDAHVDYVVEAFREKQVGVELSLSGEKREGCVALDAAMSGKLKKKAKEVRKRSIYDLTMKDIFCCVCGSSTNADYNHIVECSRCSIKVHQACYGVSKLPKGLWYCRPCRASSKNAVCVLCGYEGGAMTRALRSRAIVKSILKAWNIDIEGIPKFRVSAAENSRSPPSMSHSFESRDEIDSVTFQQHNDTVASGADLPNNLNVIYHPLRVNSLKVHNSITAGVFDWTMKQWVHVVCALWTPGTRCPNVETMGAFDVSGVAHPRAHVVCSICCRPAGLCIKCRIVNCSVKFHPWCAHQEGLLQSEVEGIDKQSVGFYGSCRLHATEPKTASENPPFDEERNGNETKDTTCARTEGYKGRKQEGFRHHLGGHSKAKSGCLVPQEQLNAWVHIIGQKSYMHGLARHTISSVEYDSRKEYARYKLTKGWKHLVVYKSGIHALGLYTSRFISRGEMVVEYVGEIVGLRVADKREKEYENGRRVQYKSACYFFRIDKEQIIDATQRGGIARFVNHSCQPNCVAKVVSVRNEKKVVFFAVRDIFPGEEITYDYHFNHEDEGKKIPCFCSSRNCRRYLN